MKKIYISGPISSDIEYQAKFEIAEEYIESKYHGSIILTPIILPAGLAYKDYMRIDMAMVECCNVLALLPKWDMSQGAVAELAYAKALEMDIIELPEELFNDESIKRHKWQAQYEC